MKKTYIKPEITLEGITEQRILAATTGVNNGDGLGDQFDPNAPTYSNQMYLNWDEDEDLDWDKL